MAKFDAEHEDALARCAFCGEVVAQKDTCAKHRLLTVHMKQCSEHPMFELDREFRSLKRQFSGKKQEVTNLEKENEGLRDVLRTIEGVSALGVALVNSEHALGRIHGIVGKELRKGDADEDRKPEAEEDKA
jgi:hypothetical protein